MGKDKKIDCRPGTPFAAAVGGEKEQENLDAYSDAACLFTTIFEAQFTALDVGYAQLLLAIAKVKRHPIKENYNEVVCASLALHNLGVS